jgi:hypothetical protein
MVEKTGLLGMRGSDRPLNDLFSSMVRAPETLRCASG